MINASPHTLSNGSARTEASLSSMMVHRVRWHTGLSQAEFATAFQIDLDHLRELEAGAVEADSGLLAYLKVIDRAPDAVRTALRAV